MVCIAVNCADSVSLNVMWSLAVELMRWLNTVALCRAQLVLEWMTSCVYTILSV